MCSSLPEVGKSSIITSLLHNIIKIYDEVMTCENGGNKCAMHSTLLFASSEDISSLKWKRKRSLQKFLATKCVCLSFFVVVVVVSSSLLTQELELYRYTESKFKFFREISFQAPCLMNRITFLWFQTDAYFLAHLLPAMLLIHDRKKNLIPIHETGTSEGSNISWDTLH